MAQRIKYGLWVAAPFLLLILVILWMFFRPSTHSLGLSAPPKGGDFEIISAQGTHSLSDYRDKVAVLYFGYTYCPDVCPTSLGILAQTLAQFDKTELSRIQPIFISVDPERDTPERLQQYASYFHSSIMGATHTPDEIAKIAQQYGVAYAKAELANSAMGYSVDHSSFTYLVDKKGQLRDIVLHGTPANELKEKIKKLLEENP